MFHSFWEWLEYPEDVLVVVEDVDKKRKISYS
jgi:hypothetical protein